MSTALAATLLARGSSFRLPILPTAAGQSLVAAIGRCAQFLRASEPAGHDWLARERPTRELRGVYFGASTGAAAALRRSVLTMCVRWWHEGAAPDLAQAYLLRQMRAPCLFIVGGEERAALELNRRAFAQVHCARGMEIIPGATHLFAEPGALDRVARLVSGWFQRWLSPERHKMQMGDARQ